IKENGFIAMSIAFEKHAGDGSQAVAVMSISDKSAFYKFTFLGPGHSLRKRCTSFTEQNRGSIYCASGFVIQNCTLAVAPGMEQHKSGFEAYLGRPWSSYSTNKPHNPDVYTTPDHPVGVIWYNATVSKTTQRAFRTIMEAIDAAPTYSVDKYIHIEVGLYDEGVDVSEQLANIVFNLLVTGKKSLGLSGVGDTQSFIPSTPQSLNCTLTVVLEQQNSGFEAYLGRPWSNYSTVIVMNSFLDIIIKPEGWLSWEGQNTNSLTYRECGNRCPGALTNEIVHWQGFKAVTLPSELRSYTVREFIDGNDWLSHTGIPNTRVFIYV
ncbi:hypothetical protein RD792_013605, partial [Penstemon davidsonii]